MRDIVIVGASLAGLRAAETLRAEGFSGALTLVGAEERRPYNRPPLSKQILTGKQSPEQIHFPDVDTLAADWRLGRKAVGLDTSTNRLTLDDGEVLGFDGLVIATGVTPRLPDLPGWGIAGTHSLRTLDDAIALKSELQAGRRLIIAGAGFIGCEVAASARELGLDVTVIDPAPSPMARVLTPDIGALFVEIHADKGTRFLFGQSVSAIGGTERVDSVCLDDGTRLEADIVLFGVGSLPATDWLNGSGLTLNGGVVCDEYCFAQGGAGRIVAAGDVAFWRNISYGGQMMRVEHWSNAVDQAISASRNLLHGPSTPYTPLMSMWSDQYEFKLQVLGAPALGGRMEIAHGTLPERRFIAECWDAERLMGVIGVNMPARMGAYRRRLEADIQAFCETYPPAARAMA